MLKRLTLTEMSSVTAPYTVNSTPRPRLPTTADVSEKDEEYPSWFLPLVIAGSVGLLLFLLVIVLYCRWKKGAPSKKIEPGATIEEEVHKPRVRDLYTTLLSRSCSEAGVMKSLCLVLQIYSK